MSEMGERMKELVRVARAARVETDLLVECVQRQIIVLEDGRWNDDAIVQARRVRRLMKLGVNLQGVEVVVRMRHRALELHNELERLQAEMDALRRRHEEEVSRLLREISREI